MSNITTLIVVGAVMFAVLGGVTLLSHIYSLNGIKSRTVGDGQHGTARWATKREIRKTYKHIPFTPDKWRKQAKNGQEPTASVVHLRLPFSKKDKTEEVSLPQGIVVGCTGNTTAMIDTGDVHALMIGAAGVGKTAYWLYPCIEYACASGMSWLSTDTKGDIMRNYGRIAKDYGYHVSVIDLRNPTKSNGNNLLHLVNKYMDLYKKYPDKLVYKARCEKYAKIISKTQQKVCSQRRFCLLQSSASRNSATLYRFLKSFRSCWRLRARKEKISFSSSWNCSQTITKRNGLQVRP